jgi:hypothetical protein
MNSQRKLHPESLLRLAPIRDLLTDPEVRLVPRAVDCAWRYEGVVPVSVSGFRPYDNQVFYGAKSSFADWLRDPTQSARACNFEDRLIFEALFAAHDYLHAWAYGVIRELKPELGLGWAPITAQNVEDLVFCHLVTEAVATVGIDYWFLSQIDIDEVCPIGTCLETLTTSYHRRHDREFARLNPDYQVDREEFFARLSTFYCTGVFEGFGIEDLKRSPRALKWLAGEVEYGELQRSYIRQWLSFLSADKKTLYSTRSAFTKGLSVSVPWRKRLIREVGNLLWRKVRRGERSPCPALPAERSFWESPATASPDFRFFNANRTAPEHLDQIQGKVSAASWECWFNQVLSGFDFARFDRSLLKKIPGLRESRNFSRVLKALGPQPRLEGCTEPKDIFFLG